VCPLTLPCSRLNERDDETEGRAKQVSVALHASGRVDVEGAVTGLYEGEKG